MVELLNFQTCCLGYLVISILFWLFSGYEYLVNARRASSDPDWRNYKPLAVFLAPLTWPFLVLGGFIVTIIKAVFFGIFLVLFSLVVALFRKPFLWRLIEPIISGIGRRLLKGNTFLIRLFERNS
jgi:hypothetical protein